jgi:hypothetical protein
MHGWRIGRAALLALGAMSWIAACGSRPTELQIPPPVFSAQPAAQTVYVGRTAVFSAAASGVRAVHYQWLRDGAPVDGATEASYTTAVLTLTDDGATFSVEATDDVGQSTLSDAAVLTVTTGFTPAGNMLAARVGHVAVLLPGGKVLLAGGNTTGGLTLSSAELYDPAADASAAFSATGSMLAVRRGATATRLPDGTVLVAGGDRRNFPQPYPASLDSAETYDSATGEFTATGNMSDARAFHTATLLGNGKVLITGGFNTGTAFLGTADLYDPATRTFAATGALAEPRNRHTATMLGDGTVLVAGGMCTASCRVETYKPDFGVFTSIDNDVGIGRWSHTATLLADGKVLMVGGISLAEGGDSLTADLASVILYSPLIGTGGPALVGSMSVPRFGHTATLLPDGKVLIVGGDDGTGPGRYATAEVYDPATEAFSPAGVMSVARTGHTATLLPSGKILIVGGDDGPGSLTSAELYDPSFLR